MRYVLLLLLQVCVAQAQVEISASIEGQTAAEVVVGDTFTYTLTINSEDSVTIKESPQPNFGNLVLLNAFSGSSTRSSYVNGQFKTEQSRTFNFALQPTKPGTVTIPPVAMEIDGHQLRSNSVQVKVLADSGRSQRPRPQAPPDDMSDSIDDMEQMFQQLLQRRLAPRGFGGGPQGRGNNGTLPQVNPTHPINPNEAFFVQVETDKTSAYVGEQITVSFYLYTRGQITDIDTLTYPSLKGFWKEDLAMATRLNFETVEVNGTPYQRAQLVSYALFPIKAGKAVIDPYKARCTVLSQSGFGFGRPYQFTKASRPVEIQVLDVPSDGRTPDYSGAVGQFRVSAQFEPASVPVNQPATLRVRFEGRGNAKLIELPNLKLPPSMELYDQKSDAKFFKDGTSYKQFEVLLIPREAGIVEIPPVKTSAFDPAAKKYEIISSQPMRLNVLGSGVSAPVTVAQVNDDVPTKPQGPTLPGLSTEFSGSSRWVRYRAAVWSIVYLGVFVFLSIMAWMVVGRKPRKINLQLLLKRRMKAVEVHIASGEIRKVGVELTNAAYFILGQISEQGGASQEVSRLLESAPPSLRKELAEPIQSLLSRSEALSFAPEAMLREWSDKGKLVELKKEFERVMSRAIEMVDFQEPS